MKKQYITPAIKMLLIEERQSLLAGSADSLLIDNLSDPVDPGLVDAPEFHFDEDCLVDTPELHFIE